MMKKCLMLSLSLSLSMPLIAEEQQISVSEVLALFQKEAIFVSQPNIPGVLIGEQIDFSPPEGKTLAMRYLSGNPNYSYSAEYIEDKENIENWKGYYFAQTRMKSPLVLLVHSSIEGIHRACDNLLVDSFVSSVENFQEDKPVQPNYNNSSYFYFCNKALPNAPYGEGGYINFIEGKEFNFKYWVAWRPEKAYSEPGEIIFKLESLMPKEINICNPEKGIACKYNHNVK